MRSTRRGFVACLTSSLIARSETEFQSLFNGKDLSGWTLFAKSGLGYRVDNGVLICPEDGGGNLLTNEEFADFEFRFEFKLSPGGNNGVGIRAPLAGDIAYSGMEIQILDHGHDQYKGWLKPTQRHGSIYDVIPAVGDALKPAGEWNHEEITAEGPHIKVVLNGATLVNADLRSVTDPEVLKKHPGLLRKNGRIGFLGHKSRVEFRNVGIRRL